MAIIFISPKKRQRMFIGIISLVLIVGLSVISALIFLPELKRVPENAPLAEVGAPAIAINFSLIDSPQVKNLETFKLIEANFIYVAQNQAGRQVAGTISAASLQEAEQKLQAQNLKVINIQQVPVGRSEPFSTSKKP